LPRPDHRDDPKHRGQRINQPPPAHTTGRSTPKDLDTYRSVRNVQDRLPQRLRSVVTARMRRAYHADSAVAAESDLAALATELDRTHPGAAASLREGMAETLTVVRLGVPPTLARTLRSTNCVER